LLQTWYQGLSSLAPDAAMGRRFWQQLMTVRTAVNKAMEAQRAAGALRGSLDAAVTLYCSADLHASLHALGDELRFVLITSAATLLPLDVADADAVSTELPELRLQIAVAIEEKCERCWHRSADVGHSTVHVTLCGRCIENIEGAGERRLYA
jgi:isoleucyl-tRNA synthetase